MDLTAKDIMSSPAVCTTEEATVQDLLSLLDHNQISGVPVVDTNNRLTGVISITDLLSLSIEAAEAGISDESDFHTSPAMDGLAEANGLLVPDQDVLELPVGDLMSRNVRTATEETAIGEIAHALLTHKIHRLIIVRKDLVVGIVSTGDILRTLEKRYHTKS
jgi:CBS domain-containing protein